jgi:predicted site-specific integrase-resolvase
MVNNPKVHIIPPVPAKRDKRVGIYCRVSTNSSEQLKSLTAQVSHLTRITAATPQWLIVDVYMDIATSKTGSSRKEFTRMLNDCGSNKLDIILTKSISRFGRDTVEILDALNQLKLLGVRVIFEQEELDTANTDSNLMISIIECIAQAENVRLIYDLYLRGQSVIGIVRELERCKFVSPTGKEKWCKRTIDVMLSNEKYTGNVRLLKSGKSEVHYLASDNNPAIISSETFEAVQIEKARRSNVVRGEEWH